MADTKGEQVARELLRKVGTVTKDELKTILKVTTPTTKQDQ